MAAGKQLAARLRATYSMVDVSAASGEPVASPITAVLAAAPAADLVLDVRSQVYGFSYIQSDPSSFFVMSTLWARLIDARTRALVAEARCLPAQVPFTASLENLLADRGSAIKAGLASYVEPCVEQMARKMQL